MHNFVLLQIEDNCAVVGANLTFQGLEFKGNRDRRAGGGVNVILGDGKGDPVMALGNAGCVEFGVRQSDLQRVAHGDPKQKGGHDQRQQKEQKTLAGR